MDDGNTVSLSIGGLPYLTIPVTSSEEWVRWGGKMEDRFAAVEVETGRVSVNQYLDYHKAVDFTQKLNEKRAFMISKAN